MVAVSGWLLIPSLVAALVSTQQAIGRSDLAIEYKFYQIGEMLGLKNGNLRDYVKQNMEALDRLK